MRINEEGASLSGRPLSPVLLSVLPDRVVTPVACYRLPITGPEEMICICKFVPEKRPLCKTGLFGRLLHRSDSEKVGIKYYFRN